MILLLALACGAGDTGEVVEEAAVPAQRRDGVAHVAPVRRAPMALPPRFETPLRQGLMVDEDGTQLYDEAQLPPRDWYAHRVCRGGPQRADWWDAVSSTAAHTDAEQLAWFEGWVGHCEDPGWCAWVRDRLGAEATPASARPLLQWQLSGCAGARDLLVHAPADAVVAWHAAHPSPWDPTLSRAVEEVVTLGEVWPSRRAAMVLGAVDDPRAGAQLVALAREAPTALLRDAVVAGLHSQGGPEARQLFAELCARPLEERDLLCDGGSVEWLSPAQRVARVDLEALGRALRDYQVMPADVTHVPEDRWPRLSVVLVDCVQDPGLREALRHEDPSAAVGHDRCLAALAHIQRKTAVRTVRPRAERGGDLTPLAARLWAWPDLAAARVRLAELDLVGPSEGPTLAVEPLELVVGSGRGRWLDGEHWSHAAMARDLAELVDLEGVSFEEVPPLYDDAWMPMGEGLYWVHAYEGPWRTSAPARDWGDWLDVDQVVGLLNALLEARGVPKRLVVASGWDGTRAVVGGSSESLVAAEDEGLLLVVEPEAPPEEGLEGALEGLLR